MSVETALSRVMHRFLPKRRSLPLALVLAAASAIPVATIDPGAGAAAKTPGKQYCFLGRCHRVLTLAETRRRVGRRASVIASFYQSCKHDRYNPCGLTASGAVFRPSHADNAASPIYPNGTKLMVWNPATRKAAIVRIDNAGPYWGNRTLDLSIGAARKLGFSHRGVARLTVAVLYAPTRAEATYRRRRVYAPVAGYLGRFASLETALAASGQAGTTAPGPAKSAAFAATGRQHRPADVTLPVRNTFVLAHLAWKAATAAAQTEAAAQATIPSATQPTRMASVTLPVPLTRAEFARLRLRKPVRLAALSRTPARTARTARQDPRLTNREVPDQAERRDAPRKAHALPRHLPKARPDQSPPRRNRRQARDLVAETSKPVRDKQQPAQRTTERTTERPAEPNRDGKQQRAAGQTAGAPQAGASPGQRETKGLKSPAAADTPKPVTQPRFAWRQKYFDVNNGGT